MKELENLLNNSIVLGYHILLTGHRNAPVLQGIVRLPEQIFPVIFQAFVERSHDSDTDHRTDEAAHRRDLPVFEQHRFTVADVERHLRIAESKLVTASNVKRLDHTYRHTVHAHVTARIVRRGFNTVHAPVVHTPVIHAPMVHIPMIHTAMIHMMSYVHIMGCVFRTVHMVIMRHLE